MNLTNPPSIATLVIPKCGLELCPWKQFKQIALTSINTECVQEPLQSSLQSMLTTTSSSRDHKMPTWELVLIVIFVTIATVGLCSCTIIRYLMYTKRLFISTSEYKQLLSDNPPDQKDISNDVTYDAPTVRVKSVDI